jgi:hypothetical protein
MISLQFSVFSSPAMHQGGALEKPRNVNYFFEFDWVHKPHHLKKRTAVLKEQCIANFMHSSPCIQAIFF